MKTLMKIASWFTETIVSILLTLPVVAAKSLIYAPVFYLIYTHGFHHAPPGDVWYGFAVAAMMFSQSSSKEGRAFMDKMKGNGRLSSKPSTES